MASGDGQRSVLRLIIVVTIVTLVLLMPFTIYYLHNSPHLLTKGLVFTPSPTLEGTRCKNISLNNCSCSKHESIDYTKCPLKQPFAVYVYKDDIVPLRYPSDVTDIELILKETNSWTDTPSKACLLVHVVGPSSINSKAENVDQKLSSLPDWNDGVNHVLIDIPEVGLVSSQVSSSGSMLVANGLVMNDVGLDNILTPPVSHSQVPLAPPPPLYEKSRPHLLYFEGQSSRSVSSTWLDSAKMKDLKFNVQFTCEHSRDVIHGSFDEEWSLCAPQNQRLRNCSNSSFALILGAPYASAITYTRLVEALKCGAVPVIAGVKRLPFDSVINWNKAAILLPVLMSPHNLSDLLTNLLPEVVMDYRRQGRFLFETYFSSRKAVLWTIIAILRSRFMHPPPAAQDFNGKVFKVNDDVSAIPPSPRFSNKYTIYSEDLWNNPPGPFFMYPVNPYRHPYVPLMFNEPAADNAERYTKPPVLKGDPFRASLHGIHPSEGFTVVALTYHRSQHLAEFVKGFKGCSFLAKIVIVWNDENESAKSFKLPNIGVPIEVGLELYCMHSLFRFLECFH